MKHDTHVLAFEQWLYFEEMNYLSEYFPEDYSLCPGVSV